MECRYFDQCSNNATPLTPYCRKCGAALNRWKKRPREDIAQRVNDLALYSRRMQSVAAETAKTKLARKRRAA